MFGLGMGEILFLAILGLIVIGPDDLPKLARQLGRFLNELKRTTESFTQDLKEQAKFDPKEYLKEVVTKSPSDKIENTIVPPKVMDQMSDEEYQIHIGGNHQTPKPTDVSTAEIKDKSAVNSKSDAEQNADEKSANENKSKV